MSSILDSGGGKNNLCHTAHQHQHQVFSTKLQLKLYHTAGEDPGIP